MRVVGGQERSREDSRNVFLPSTAHSSPVRSTISVATTRQPHRRNTMSTPPPTLDLHPVLPPTVHPAPTLSHPSLIYTYTPSPSSITSNLLILFHGLGDTHLPFSTLGKSLNLPQTAVLSLRGPERVPLLEEEAWSWWMSFDPLGECTFFARLSLYLLHLLPSSLPRHTANPPRPQLAARAQ